MSNLYNYVNTKYKIKLGDPIFVYTGDPALTGGSSPETLGDFVSTNTNLSPTTYSTLYNNINIVETGIGLIWNNRTSGTTSSIYSVIYANGLYVYGGWGGALATSTDGVTWTPRTSGTINNINSITYGNGLYVYAGVAGVVATSTDAVTWTVRTSGVNNTLNTIIWDGSKFVANGFSLISSPDGITWNVHWKGGGGTSGLESLAYSPSLNRVVGTGYNGILVTSDDRGENWIQRTNLTTNRSDFVGWFSNVNLFIMTASSGFLATSPDGITWTQRTTGTTTSLHTIIWNGTYFICATQTTGTILRSTDGINWSYITGLNFTSAMTRVMANSSITIQFPLNGGAWYSPNNDLTNWTNIGSIGSGSESTGTYSPELNLFVVAGSSGIYTSTNGTTWTLRRSSPNTCFEIVWTGTYFMICSRNKVIKSTDGITWTDISMGMPQASSIVFTGNNTAIVGSPFTQYGEVIIRSTDDGESWRTSMICGYVTKIIKNNNDYIILTDDSLNGRWKANSALGFNGLNVSGGFTRWNDGVYASGSYVIVGGSAKLHTSVDGITWTARSSGASSTITSITYANNLYVYVGLFGIISTSVDGITWVTRTSNTTSNINSITYGNSSYVYVGTEGLAGNSTQDTANFYIENVSPLTVTSVSNLTTKVGKQYIKYTNTDVSDLPIGTVIDNFNPNNQVSYSLLDDRFIKIPGIYLKSDYPELYALIGSVGTKTGRQFSLTSGTTSTINSVTYGNNLYVYVGNGGILQTSIDAVTWTARSSGTTSTINSVTYGNNLYVYVGNGGLIATSNNGVDWNIGPSSSTFNTIDYSINPKTLTFVGSATISSSTSKSNGYSCFFSGTSYITVNSSSDFAFGTGDFTIECWIYKNGSNGTIFTTMNSDNSSTGISVWTSSGIGVAIGSTNLISNAGSMGVNTWIHVAVTREGGVIRAFLNGVEVGNNSTGTAGTNLTDTNCRINGQASGTFDFINGFLDDIRITKGVARYTANFTPPTSAYPDTSLTDPFYSNVSLLTTLDFSPIFIDQSYNPKLIFRNGGARPTESTFISAPQSLYLNGSSFLEVPSSSSWAYGTGDFTIEFWANWNTVSSTLPGNIICGTVNGTTISVYVTNTNIEIARNNSGPDLVVSSTQTTGVWNHYAFVRSSGTGYIFKDGILLGSGAVSTNFQASSLRIGAGSLGTSYVNGYLDDIRITKGVARYTSNFTPPPSLGSIDTYFNNVTLLLNMNGINGSTSFTDISLNPKTVTSVGSASVSTSISKYGNGSLSLNGTNQNLSIPNTSGAFDFGTGEFTVECWVYLNTAPTNESVMSGGSTASGDWMLAIFSTTIQWGRNLISWDLSGSASLTLNVWHHIAVSRVGSTTRIFLNGNVIATKSSDTTSYNCSNTNTLFVGRRYEGNFFEGNIDDVRITKGIGRYSTTFTVPSEEFTNITDIYNTNVELLLTMSISYSSSFGTTSTIYSITYSNGLYVYAGAGGTLATSTDSVAWTARTSGTTSNILSVTYGNGLYVYAGLNGAMGTSTDATTWSLVTGFSTTYRKVVYGNGVYVAVGDFGVIRTSTNGTVWTTRTSGTGSSITALVYDNTKFVAVYNNGAIISTDGITWNAINRSGTTYIFDIVYSGTKYIYCGSFGYLEEYDPNYTFSELYDYDNYFLIPNNDSAYRFKYIKAK